MAEITNVTLIDDLDGESEADETVLFGLDGKHYEIDLTEDNATQLRDLLDVYIEAGRKVRDPGKPGRGPKRRGTGGNYASTDPERNQAIREWARDNGYNVNARGRIPADIVDAYESGTPASGQHDAAQNGQNTPVPAFSG